MTNSAEAEHDKPREGPTEPGWYLFDNAYGVTECAYCDGERFANHCPCDATDSWPLEDFLGVGCTNFRLLIAPPHSAAEIEAGERIIVHGREAAIGNNYHNRYFVHVAGDLKTKLCRTEMWETYSESWGIETYRAWLESSYWPTRESAVEFARGLAK